MKTRINVKSSRKTKPLKSKKTIAQSRKQDTSQKQKKHSYYIILCNNGLDETVLSRHLRALRLIPDAKAMYYVENQYNKIAAKYKLTKKEFCNSLNKKSIVKIPEGLVKADIIFYHINNNILNKPFYKYSKFLCNTINIEYSMLDKHMIYSNIIKYNSRSSVNMNYFIKTYSLSDKNKFQFPGNYILRPVYAFGGRDILYVHNPIDLEKAIKYYDTHKDIRNHSYSPQEITVSKIITDLLLFKSRKFHLRMYYMVAILEGELSCFILDFGKILTAKYAFNLDVPFSKGVHDTHLGSTDFDYFYPNDLTLENISILDDNKDIIKKKTLKDIHNNILKYIRKITRGITGIVIGLSNGKPNSLLYENQQNGYYIYGLDILVRDNLEPVLIECNNQTGYETLTITKNKELSNIIYGWINETILEPLFKHPGHATQYARKHKTYISLDDL